MSRRKRVLSALAIAVGMLIFSYLVTNQCLAISGETVVMRKVELVRGWFQPHINPMADSVLLINVAYDKEQVIKRDAYNEPMGYDAITDREKLYQLLSELKHKDDSLLKTEHRGFYKYVLLDVIFADDIRTPQDSALFSLITSMKRIVIPNDINTSLADTCLYAKAGPANYFTNYKFVSFTKFPYLYYGQKSLPLKMYEELTGHRVNDHSLFLTDDGRLARRSIVLPFELRCDSALTADGEKVWLNMGADLLGSTYTYSGDTITGYRDLYDYPELTQDKYIVIGAFSGGDMHYSYMENQPGSAILFNAYLSLLHGHHIVSPWFFVLLLAVFYVMAYLILGNQTIDAFLTDIIPHGNYAITTFTRVIIFIVSWVGYSLLLSILCIFTYLVMGEVYDIFITATVFQLISMATRLINKKR